MHRTHHAIDYVELAGGDLEATKAFYASAFGWEFTDYGPEYAGIRVPARLDPSDPSDSGGGTEVGGIDGTVTGSAGSTLVLLYSDDLDTSVAGVRAAGGTVTKEPYDFPGGRASTSPIRAATSSGSGSPPSDPRQSSRSAATTPASPSRRPCAPSAAGPGRRRR